MSGGRNPRQAPTPDSRCSVKVRSGLDYQAITTLPEAIKIHVIGGDGYWLKVESKHGGESGHVDELFARPKASAPSGTPTRFAPAVVGAYRTVRDIELHEPTANSPVVTKLPARIKVNVIGAEGDWLRVESKKISGALAGWLVCFEKRLAASWRINSGRRIS